MATTSPDTLRTPNPTDPYNLVSDMAVLATDVQTALVRRANSYIGTVAQRTAFTTAPEGVHWQDTDGTKLTYVRQSGVWNPLVPTKTIGAFIPAANSSIRATSSLTLDTTTGEVMFNLGVSRTVWTSAGTTLVATIPVGFRPSTSVLYPSAQNGAGAPGIYLMEFGTDGTVSAITSPTNGQSWLRTVSGVWKI